MERLGKEDELGNESLAARVARPVLGGSKRLSPRELGDHVLAPLEMRERIGPEYVIPTLTPIGPLASIERLVGRIEDSADNGEYRDSRLGKRMLLDLPRLFVPTVDGCLDAAEW